MRDLPPPTVDGVSLDDLEAELLKSLVATAADRNVPAASAALAVIERRRKTRAAELHQARLVDLQSDPIGLCHYLGTLGTRPTDLQHHLGHQPTPAESDAFEAGQRGRLLEMRAVELGRVRRGEIPPPEWATTRHLSAPSTRRRR